MTREAILKQMNELYLVHTQPTLTIFKDGTMKSEVRWVDSEAEKLFYVLQKYLVKIRSEEMRREYKEQQRRRPNTNTAIEIKFLQPPDTLRSDLMFDFYASELNRVCGITNKKTL